MLKTYIKGITSAIIFGVLASIFISSLYGMEPAPTGQMIFSTSCSGCHLTGAGGCPSLTNLKGRTTIVGGLLRNNPDNLAKWIRDPQAVKPGTVMPDLGLSDRDIDAVVAYILTL